MVDIVGLVVSDTAAPPNIDGNLVSLDAPKIGPPLVELPPKIDDGGAADCLSSMSSSDEELSSAPGANPSSSMKSASETFDGSPQINPPFGGSCGTATTGSTFFSNIEDTTDVGSGMGAGL